MQQKFILEQAEVRNIIAQKFSVNPQDVFVKIVDRCHGYGLNEHYEKEVAIIINKYTKGEQE